MDRDSREQLSALFDAELSELERRRLLTDISDDRQSIERFAGYQLIGEVIRSEGSVPPVRPEFAEAVSSRLQSESPQTPSKQQSLSGGWLKVASGFSIAASVAAMAIYLVSPGGDESFSFADAGIAALTPKSEIRPVGGTRWETVTPETEQKLNRYLVNHGEYASGKGMNRVVPYATYVSYDLGR